MSIANLLKYIEAITLLLPLVEKVVELIERLFSKIGGKNGEVKKELAINMVKTLSPPEIKEIPENLIGETIDSIVEVNNLTGKFSHSTEKIGSDGPQGGF